MKFAIAALRTVRETLLSVLLLASVGSAMQGPPLYHVTDLRDAVEQAFPGVQFPSSRARGLNEDGDLVGEASTGGSQQQAWVYTVEHGLTPLPFLPGWTSNVALGISDRDVSGVVTIVGGGIGSIYWDISIGEAMLWRYSAVTGTVLETRSIGIPAGSTDSLAVAVNDAGTVVGYSDNAAPLVAWKYDVATRVLETFGFPVRPTDVNDLGQVCGGRYRGDLFGNFQDMGAAPSTHSTSFVGINESGSMVGRAGTSQSDGAGHFLATVVRWSDTSGWTALTPVSHLTLAGAINEAEDFTTAQGGLYLESEATLYSVPSLMAPEFHTYGAGLIAELNDNRQIAAVSGHAVLLTPLGVMVVPGDVNGDVQVDLDDLCAFVANPIDLDGDGVVTAADETWLVDRLAVFGYFPQDCDASGTYDHCDIESGASTDCDGNGVPDSCQADCSGDGIPDACEPDCNGNGTPDACDLQAGTSPDCNANGIPDECDAAWTVPFENTFVPPVQVLQGATIVDDVFVPDTGVVADVDVTFDIRYRIGQLTVELSHGGTTITLIEEPGVPEFGALGSGQLGYDIVLDDEGTGGPIEDEGNFGSPFEPILSPPNYTPDEALAAFDGMPIEGIWTITIRTNPAFGSPVEELNGWGVTITSESVPVPPCACQSLVTSYCSSTPNSTGAAAQISSNLQCSVADNLLELHASPVPSSPGLFFYGPAQVSVPFGNGFRCVASGGVGLFRLPVRQGVNGTLSDSLDLTNPPRPAGAITPGSTWYFQAWYRDPSAGGALVDTSDGLRITFLP